MQRIVPLPRIAGDFGLLLGIVLVVSGASINVWSIGLFRRKHTSLIPIKPTNALVETGVYSYTRNPMYLGLLITYSGVAMVQHQWWPIMLIPGVVLCINLVVIRREEQYLERRFGEEFRRYKLRVRRWV